MARAKKPTSTADLPAGISLTQAGTYRVRWRDAGGTADGKTFKRLIDAETHLAAVRTDLRRGVYVDPGAARITVARFADEWLAGARNLAPGGREAYRRDLDQYILPELGGLPLSNLSAKRIDAFLSEELEAGKAPSSVLRYYRTIHRMCEIAVRKGRLQANPCVTVEAPRVPPSEMRFLSVDQVLALANAIGPQAGDRNRRGHEAADEAAARQYRAWVLVAAFGGPRWSETVGLRRANVDRATVRIVEQLVRRADGQWHREPPKSAAGRRTVTLPAVAARAVALHLRDLDDDPDTLVFPNRNGGPASGSNFRSNVFKPALARAGLDHDVRIHDLRHTAVALAIKAGAHPKAIQARMGHASIAVTLDRYGHLFPEMDGEIASAIDGLVAEVNRPARRIPVRSKAPVPAKRGRGRAVARRRSVAV